MERDERNIQNEHKRRIRELELEVKQVRAKHNLSLRLHTITQVLCVLSVLACVIWLAWR
jgi:hypothetical protein